MPASSQAYYDMINRVTGKKKTPSMSYLESRNQQPVSQPRMQTQVNPRQMSPGQLSAYQNGGLDMRGPMTLAQAQQIRRVNDQSRNAGMAQNEMLATGNWMPGPMGDIVRTPTMPQMPIQQTVQQPIFGKEDIIADPYGVIPSHIQGPERQRLMALRQQAQVNVTDQKFRDAQKMDEQRKQIAAERERDRFMQWFQTYGMPTLQGSDMSRQQLQAILGSIGGTDYRGGPQTAERYNKLRQSIENAASKSERENETIAHWLRNAAGKGINVPDVVIQGGSGAIRKYMKQMQEQNASQQQIQTQYINDALRRTIENIQAKYARNNMVGSKEYEEEVARAYDRAQKARDEEQYANPYLYFTA